MNKVEIQALIIRLLSSIRQDDKIHYCRGMTKRQILDRIEGVLAPNQNQNIVSKIMERVSDQLKVLEQEFEVISTGDTRRIYSMAAPSLIIQREEPFLAKYVGDRAYLELVIELIDGRGGLERTLVGSLKGAQEIREILEARGVSVQTESMLFQSVENPSLPAEVDLSMAEEIALEDFGGGVEVYVPRRAEFFVNRWSGLGQELPSSESYLYRVKPKSLRKISEQKIYLWKKGDVFFKLLEEQALRALYAIDLERNTARLLNLEGKIPKKIVKELPRDYQRLLLRYTEECDEAPVSNLGGIKGISMDRSLRIRPKYKGLITELLEGKLGINREMN
jgi:hypothetical protein